MSDLNVYTQDQFDKDGISYGFFGRRGGVSAGIYDSLNTGFGAKDDTHANIDENRARIAAHIGATSEHLVNVYQVHGAVCETVHAPWVNNDTRPKADAMVTDKAGIALGVLTADCGPVLFHGRKSDGAPVIGGAHAGWRGALAGVLQSTVKQMIKLGAERESIHACIGPCIQKRSYEVSTEFFEHFMAQSKQNERFFVDGRREGHPHFDLSGYCAAQIQSVGVNNVYITGLNTYARGDDFFSCRRAAHNNEPDYGRQISVIMIV